MATKIIAIVQENYDESDLVSIVRRALLDAGMAVDSVDAHYIYDKAVLYLDLGNGRRRYVLEYEADEVRWTDDIDAALLFEGNRNIERGRVAVKAISKLNHEVLAV